MSAAGDPTAPHQDPTSWGRLIDSIDGDLQRRVPNAAGRDMELGKLLRALPVHEIHHRGAMCIYLNLFGVDTPPVLPSTDAGVLSARADGTLLVVRLERSLKKQSREAVRVLQDMGGNLLGTFVTELRGKDPESDHRLAYEMVRPEDE